MIRTPRFYRQTFGVVLLAGAALWCVGVLYAFGQEAEKVPVPLAVAEQKIILEMCEAAKYGFRAQFDPLCPGLKARFDEANAAKAGDKPPFPAVPDAISE